MFRLILISIIGMLFTGLFSTISLASDNALYFFGSFKTNFVVTDPMGRKTGFDIITNQSFKEIPNAAYWESGFGGPLEPQPDNFMELQIRNPIDGIYKIKVTGSKLGQVSVLIDYPRPLGVLNIGVGGFSDVNKVDYFEVNYSYATGMAGQVMPITHIASSSTLIDDINVMQKMGYIGNPKFVSELTKEINEIESKRTKVDPSHGSGDDGLTPAQKAKKEYQELLKEITEKYNKPESDEFVKQEAYTVLKEDIEYIISHIQ